MKTTALIMAGGKGERFWPKSRLNLPKQFLSLTDDGKTMIQLTVERISPIVDIKDVYIATNKNYKELVKQQLPGIPEENILCEPIGRNTAPCIGLGAVHISKKYDDAVMVVLPSDHLIKNNEVFVDTLKNACEIAESGSNLVTIGITPNYPETGYGYIEADLTIPSTSNKEVYRVYSFKEKPDLETAEIYIKINNFFWNAGIFVWNVSTVVNALRVYQPAISKIFERLLPYYYTEQEQEMINQNFPLCENISVDYAIMEKADEIFVFPSDFGWSDLGTWGSLHGNLPKDAHNNTQIGQNIKLYETRNCVIHTTQEKKVVVQGLDGYIVAEKDDTLLICRLSEEQRIKEFSAE